MAAGSEHRTRKTAELVDAEITAGLERIRTRAAGVEDAAELLALLDTLDERRVVLRDRLDGMPDVGGAWGMASDTPLAGLADVSLRVQRLEQVLGEQPDPASVAAATRIAAEPLPRPVRLLSHQQELLDRVRRDAAPPWLAGCAGW